MKKMFSVRIIILVSFCLLLGVWRFFLTSKELSAIANFTPLGALALFGGTYMKGKIKPYLFPLLILLFSDIIIMNTIYKPYRSGILYSGWIWNYAAFALIVLIAQWMRRRSSVTVKSFLVCAVLASLTHFIVSDIGVWLNGFNILTGKPFSKDIYGFLDCLYLALPFLRNFLAATIFYGAIIFLGFEFIDKKIALSSPAKS